MECRELGAIGDEELLAYIDGKQVAPAVRVHLEWCQECSSKLAAYQRMDRKLIQRLYRWDCPANQVLGEYQLDLLDGEQTARVRDHLLKCVLCAAEIITLVNFLSNDPLLFEPAFLPSQVAINSHKKHHVHDVKQMVEKWRTEGIASVQRIVATLLAPEPRLAYQRDVVDSLAQWPRRYSAEGLTISVQVERTPQHAHQRGSLQLLGFVTCDGKGLEELQGTSVLLSSQTKGEGERDQNMYTQVIDDLGNFLFSALEPDTYMLEVQLPERIIAIEQLSLTM